MRNAWLVPCAPLRPAPPRGAFSGFLGGKLAYRYGVRVADESTQAEGYVPGDAGRA
ncbi:hypothetical protein [Streptomyces sp. 3214.6]|uniref:hypothetical protein n=1 Tax=Streptomyces sp. 3214.6 TaxID=1882757 RepID=UPI00135208F8|nr:hypothetical protein [Streptomyces sp. 3214.6]